MFGFRRTKGEETLPFSVDMHSHLLPGVDDGAPTAEASLSLITGLQSLGLRRLITTPHIYTDLYPNSPATLQPAFDGLKRTLDSARMEVDLTFGAEYFMDDTFEELVSARSGLLTLANELVLIETSFVQPPISFDNQIFTLKVAGYKPVLAHPERYPYWHMNREKYHDLFDNGVLLQVNLLSIIGYYGRNVADAARYLIQNELAAFAGTDCHHERHVDALKRGVRDIRRSLDGLIKKGKLLNDAI